MATYSFSTSSFKNELWINGKRVFKKPTGVSVEFTNGGAFDWVFADSSGKVVKTLVDQNRVNWQNRAHLFGAAAQIIRRILVDHARARHRQKRSGNAVKVSLSDGIIGAEPAQVNVIALDDALTELAKLDPQQERVIELRFFAGLSIEETAEALNMSAATVKRDWATARGWLYREMTK